MQHFPQAIAHPLFKSLSQAGEEIEQPVYVIGGYVRDFFLGKGSKDADFVTLGSGIRLAEAFARKVGATKVATYENFGTALVVVDDFHMEFVGARKESYRKDSRKPIVENGTLEDDQLRRDFTINALSLSLQTDDWGALHDPFQGLADLKEGILRTPQNPGITFSDDPLRMMRAIRFATQLQFFIAEDAYKAICQYNDRIHIISKERITDELNKVLLAEAPSAGLKLLSKTGLLPHILPELEAMHGIEEQGGLRHKDNFYHTLQVVDNLARLNKDDLWLRWSALLHDIAKPLTKKFEPGNGWTFHGHEDKGARMVPGIFRRLKLPQNEHMRFVQKMVRLHQRPIALVNEQVTDAALRRLVVDAEPDLEKLMTLCRADITTRNDDRKKRYLANFDKVERRVMEVLERDRLRNWQPVVSGELLIERYQLTPGPAIGILKNAVREAILEGEIPNELDAAWAWLDTRLPVLLKDQERPASH
ncbi:MAG: HD domain-containing protein [Bacteroidetes bacterium]|nr:HD domain-containing protein [Bacteroidota bacterium]